MLTTNSNDEIQMITMKKMILMVIKATHNSNDHKNICTNPILFTFSFMIKTKTQSAMFKMC